MTAVLSFAAMALVVSVAASCVNVKAWIGGRYVRRLR